MIHSGGIQFVRIEEELNNLLQDEKIRALRTASVDFVSGLLRQRMLTRLESSWLSETVQQGYLSGDPEITKQLYAYLQEQGRVLGFSQDKMRQLKRQGKRSRRCALDYLLEELLKKEKIRFREEAGISGKVWGFFERCTIYIGEATQEKLCAGLQMTQAQREEFNRRLLRSVFPVDKNLRDEVHTLRERTGMTLTEFQNYAFIGKEAWEAFYPSKKDPNQLKKTSQDTLLKLVIGFSLDEPGAWDFMGKAKSVFAMRKDLVFLACIRCRDLDPMDVQEILEFFAEDPYGDRYYVNPYG